MESIDGSAVAQVLSLEPGQVFSRSKIFPAGTSRQELLKARQQLMSYLSPVVARAKLQDYRNYRIHTAVGMTKDYDVIVTGIIMSEDDDDIEI